MSKLVIRDLKVSVETEDGSKEILKGEYLEQFDRWLNTFKNKPLIIRIPNALGKALGEHLMSKEFSLELHIGTHSYLSRVNVTIYLKQPTRVISSYRQLGT